MIRVQPHEAVTSFAHQASKPIRSARTIVSVSVSAALALCSSAAHAQAPANYSLAWSDNFAGVASSSGVPNVDSARWWWRIGVASNGTQQAANVTLDGLGSMHIANASKVVNGTTLYSGGGLVTPQTFRYGYYQVTAMLPVNPTSRYHTAFWLTGAYNQAISGNPAPAPQLYTEIDGYEINSDTTTTISMGWFSWSGSTYLASVRCNQNYHPSFDPSATSHNYGIEWTETGITYYIDGAVVCGPQAVSSTQSAASPMRLWLTSIPYGATGTPTTGANATFSAAQFYARDYYVNPGDAGYAEYGSGWGTSSVAGFSSQPVRWDGTAGDYVTYTPNIVAGGNYDVQAYVAIGSAMDTATSVTVNTSTGSVALPVGTWPTTGSSRWVDLGSYNFNPGSASNVIFQVGNNNLRVSMVKFVKQ